MNKMDNNSKSFWSHAQDKWEAHKGGLVSATAGLVTAGVLKKSHVGKKVLSSFCQSAASKAAGIKYEAFYHVPKEVLTKVSSKHVKVIQRIKNQKTTLNILSKNNLEPSIKNLKGKVKAKFIQENAKEYAKKFEEQANFLIPLLISSAISAYFFEDVTKRDVGPEANASIKKELEGPLNELKTQREALEKELEAVKKAASEIPDEGIRAEVEKKIKDLDILKDLQVITNKERELQETFNKSFPKDSAIEKFGSELSRNVYLGVAALVAGKLAGSQPAVNAAVHLLQKTGLNPSNIKSILETTTSLMTFAGGDVLTNPKASKQDIENEIVKQMPQNSSGEIKDENLNLSSFTTSLVTRAAVHFIKSKLGDKVASDLAHGASQLTPDLFQSIAMDRVFSGISPKQLEEMVKKNISPEKERLEASVEDLRKASGNLNKMRVQIQEQTLQLKNQQNLIQEEQELNENELDGSSLIYSEEKSIHQEDEQKIRNEYQRCLRTAHLYNKVKAQYFNPNPSLSYKEENVPIKAVKLNYHNQIERVEDFSPYKKAYKKE